MNVMEGLCDQMIRINYLSESAYIARWSPTHAVDPLGSSNSDKHRNESWCEKKYCTETCTNMMLHQFSWLCQGPIIYNATQGSKHLVVTMQQLLLFQDLQSWHQTHFLQSHSLLFGIPTKECWIMEYREWSALLSLPRVYHYFVSNHWRSKKSLAEALPSPLVTKHFLPCCLNSSSESADKSEPNQDSHIQIWWITHQTALSPDGAKLVYKLGSIVSGLAFKWNCHNYHGSILVQLIHHWIQSINGWSEI